MFLEKSLKCNRKNYFSFEYPMCFSLIFSKSFSEYCSKYLLNTHTTTILYLLKIWVFYVFIAFAHSSLQLPLFFVFYFFFFSEVFLDKLGKVFSCLPSVNFVETCDQYRTHFIGHIGKWQCRRSEISYKFHDPSITWSFKITWQIENISPPPQSLKSSKLAAWWLRVRSFHLQIYMNF